MRKRQGGFIDPLSLISLGFLVITLLVGTVAVNKQNANYDARSRAKVIKDSEIETKKVAPNSLKKIREIEIAEEKKAALPVQPPQVTVPVNNLEPEETRFIQQEAVKKTTPTPIPTPVPTINTNYPEEGRYTQQLILPTPTPTPVTITKSDYQKCLDKGNTPAECSGIAVNIGQKVTTPLGQTECTAGEKFCSGNNLKICSNSGTWGLQTCSYGCAAGACKPKPVETAPAAPAPTAQLPESVTYQPGALPPQVAAVNPQNDPLSLAQNPMMAATLNQKIQDCINKGFTQTQCSQAFRKAADTKDTCVAFYMLENPNANLNQTQDRCNQERANTALTAAAAYAAYTILPAIGPANALRIANVADDTAALVACARGDQNACAYVLPAIANPIPGMSLASQYADDITALSRSAANYFDEAFSIMRLPDANNPAGWTPGTYGGQTIISRSNMPANLTPQEQALWIARYNAAENYTSGVEYETHLLTTSNPGYQPGSASEIYHYPSINQALQNTPDPTGYLAYLDELANTGKNPAEIASLSREFIQQQGVNIINNPHLQNINGVPYATLNDGSVVYWGSGLIDFQIGAGSTIGVYQKAGISRGVTEAGTTFAVPTTPYIPEGFTGTLSTKPSILINPAAEQILSPEAISATIAHEFGHYVESNLLSPLEASIYAYNPQLQKIELQPPELLNPNTEFLSSLYRLKYAQALAPTSINLSIDQMNSNLLLNSWIMSGGPGYLTAP